MVRMCSRLRWHLHDIDPDFAATVPARKLPRPKWNAYVRAFLRMQDGSVVVAICTELIGRIEELAQRATQLERELTDLLVIHVPQLVGAARLRAVVGRPDPGRDR